MATDVLSCSESPETEAALLLVPVPFRFVLDELLVVGVLGVAGFCPFCLELFVCCCCCCDVAVVAELLKRLDQALGLLLGADVVVVGVFVACSIFCCSSDDVEPLSLFRSTLSSFFAASVTAFSASFTLWLLLSPFVVGGSSLFVDVSLSDCCLSDFDDDSIIFNYSYFSE